MAGNVTFYSKSKNKAWPVNEPKGQFAMAAAFYFVSLRLRPLDRKDAASASFSICPVIFLKKLMLEVL